MSCKISYEKKNKNYNLFKNKLENLYIKNNIKKFFNKKIKIKIKEDIFSFKILILYNKDFQLKYEMIFDVFIDRPIEIIENLFIEIRKYDRIYNSKKFLEKNIFTFLNKSGLEIYNNLFNGEK